MSGPCRDAGMPVSGGAAFKRVLSACAVAAGALLACPAPQAMARESGEQGADPAPERAEVEPTRRPAEDLLLVEVVLGEITLTEALPAYINGGSVILPLRDLADVLEFPIDVHPSDGTASGWYLSPDRLFSLDVSRQEVAAAGEPRRFDADLIEIHVEDIFVDIRLLARWFPIDFDFDLSRLSVSLDSREPLPVERAAERELYRKRAMARREDVAAGLPRHDMPFRAAGWPIIEVDTESTLTDPPEGASRLEHRYSLLATGDLAYGNLHLYAAGNDREDLTDLRMRLERKDPDGRALGDLPAPLAVTEVAVGDLFTPQIAGVTRSRLGRGAMISTLPLDQPSEFDQVTLDGDLSLGWEVELYRNEVLLDFQAAPADGRYRFEDVPLVFGVNILRLVFYGPQGQRRVETRRFRVGAGLVRPGEVNARLVGAQNERPLFPRREADDRDTFGDRRLSAEVLAGVTRWLSVAGSAVAIPVRDQPDEQRYATGSLRLAVGDVFGRIDHTLQDRGGSTTLMSGQTTLAGVSVIGQHRVLRDGYFSERIADSTDPLLGLSSLRLEGSIPSLGIVPRLPFSLSGEHDRRESGATVTSVSKRLSAAIGLASVTNTLRWLRTFDPDRGTTRSLGGTALLGGRVGRLRLRGSGGYDLDPEARLTRVSLTGDYTLDQTWQLSAGVSHQLLNERETTYTGGVNARLGKAAVGFRLDHSDRGETVARMTLSFAVARDPRSGGLAFRDGNVAERGGVSASVYMDRDADGLRDPDEPPIEGVGLTTDHGAVDALTDAKGEALLLGLDPYQVTGLRVDPASLEDPFLSPEPAGARLVPRPGSIATIDFPVVTTGEVDGTVERVFNDGQKPVSGVRLQLIRAGAADASDGVVETETTAFDGFFLFDFVGPGDYLLRPAPDQLETLGLIAEPAKRGITIKGDGTVVTGGFVLKPGPPAPDGTAPDADKTAGPDASPPPRAAPVLEVREDRLD